MLTSRPSCFFLYLCCLQVAYQGGGSRGWRNVFIHEKCCANLWWTSIISVAKCGPNDFFLCSNVAEMNRFCGHNLKHPSKLGRICSQAVFSGLDSIQFFDQIVAETKMCCGKSWQKRIVCVAIGGDNTLWMNTFRQPRDPPSPPGHRPPVNNIIK